MASKLDHIDQLKNRSQVQGYVLSGYWSEKVKLLSSVSEVSCLKLVHCLTFQKIQILKKINFLRKIAKKCKTPKKH